MKALIHIGLPKAGSSSIQEFLKINRDALQARGIRYAPLSDRYGSQFELGAVGLLHAGSMIGDNAPRLVLQLNDRASQEAYVERFRAFLDNAMPEWTETLYVGSSEHIQPWLGSPEKIRALDTFLRQRFDEVRYLVYLRPQASLLASAYSERIRRGDTVGLDEHLEDRLKTLNFNRIVTRWEDAIGAERLDVRLLLPDTLAGGDLMTDFCQAMGVARDGLAEPRRMNNALDAETAALRLRLNRWLRVRRADGTLNPWYFRALHFGQRFLPRERTKLGLSPQQRATVETAHAASNEALRARRFPERATLF